MNCNLIFLLQAIRVGMILKRIPPIRKLLHPNASSTSTSEKSGDHENLIYELKDEVNDLSSEPYNTKIELTKNTKEEQRSTL